jgi:hypothetical protein
MKQYIIILIACIAVFASCQTNNAKGLVNADETQAPLTQYLVPINNNILSGSIQNLYKAVDENYIEPILWIYHERAQMVMSKVKIVSINNYKNTPIQQVITVRDIEGDNNEYSFFFFPISENDNTFFGDEIHILWTQGIYMLNDNNNNNGPLTPVILNRADYAGIKANDCFITDDMWRVIFVMKHDPSFFNDININWD